MERTEKSHYDALVARQVEQYRDTEVMHDLPPIYSYWTTNHIGPRSAAIIGYETMIDFYAGYFKRSLEESGSSFLVSVGSGDCSIEIEIVKKLLAQGKKDFFFICLELSPLFVEKARKKIDAEDLGDLITVAQIDINKWKPKYSFAAVMAHHSLHHVLDLENLFELIKRNLAHGGRFLTGDIIGRNGHLRWPEVLRIVRKIWESVPHRYKFSNQLHRYDEYFENWDCSIEGFEGIRAQDILPLLVKNFHFEVFCAYGNLIDTFIDRNFGPNYDPANPSDTGFIDFLQALDDKLISDGIAKPTTMIAVMKNEIVDRTRMYQHWSPSFAIRDPESPAPVFDLEPLLRDMPYPPRTADDLQHARQVSPYQFNKKISFGSTDAGTQYLKYGWSTAESDFIWSIGEAAALIFPLKETAGTDLLLNLQFIPYRSPLYAYNSIDIMVDSDKVETLQYNNSVDGGLSSVDIRIPAKIIRDHQVIEIVCLLPNRRQPQFEGGNDLRALGIALISVTISKT